MNEDSLSISVQDPLNLMSYQADFSDFLSFEEGVNSFCKFMEYLSELINSQCFSEEEHSKLEDTVNVLERLSVRLISLLQGNEEIDPQIKLKLVNVLNQDGMVSLKGLNNKKNFQHLKFLLTSLKNYPKEISTNIIDYKPSEVFEILLSENDNTLLKNGVHAYKTRFISKHSLENSRLHFAHNFFNKIRQNKMSDFKREFMTEWIFDAAVINVLLHDELIYTFITILKDTIENFGKDKFVMRGFFRALQKDFTTLHKLHLQDLKPFDNDKIEKAYLLIEPMFPCIVTLAKKDLSYVSKHIIGYLFDMGIQKEEFRMFKWNHWRWIRMIATHTWDASLREPPAWVISGGVQFCSIIFDSAPSVWLNDYAYLLIERVYSETLLDGFVPTLQHYDYIEFLVRTLKKKSPYFGSHQDSYLVLYLLSRLTPREESKEYQMKIDHLPEKNHVSQALGVLLRMTRK